uniref:Uncharacterized protein n=1 Tax=Triticum urartu TaxID=4572 RepID=A0A8R7Q1H2_TRIUA
MRRGRKRRTRSLACNQRGRSGRPWRLGSMHEDDGRSSRGPAPGMEWRRVDLAIPQGLRRRAAPWAATCRVQATAAMKVGRLLSVEKE